MATSINLEINRILTNVNNAFDEIESYGVSVQSTDNSDQLATRIAEIATKIPQSDWAQTDTTKLDYIKNKPLLKVLNTTSHSGFTNVTVDSAKIPTMAFMAYWNGSYGSGGASNLGYCNKGAFGTIVTKSADDYLPNVSALGEHSSDLTNSWIKLASGWSTYATANNINNDLKGVFKLVIYGNLGLDFGIVTTSSRLTRGDTLDNIKISLLSWSGNISAYTTIAKTLKLACKKEIIDADTKITNEIWILNANTPWTKIRLIPIETYYGDIGGRREVTPSHWTYYSSSNTYTTMSESSYGAVASVSMCEPETSNYANTSAKAKQLFYGTTSATDYVNSSGTTITSGTKYHKVISTTIPGATLQTGNLFVLKMPTTGTPCSGATININDGTNNLGAKAIKWRNSQNGTYFTASAWYLFIYDGTNFVAIHSYDSNSTYTAMIEGYCNTAADTAAKVVTSSNFGNLVAGTVIKVRFTTTNTAASALTLNVNSSGAKAIYINGEASSTSNYTLPAGTYFCYYSGSSWDIRTNGTARFRGIVSSSDTSPQLRVCSTDMANGPGETCGIEWWRGTRASWLVENYGGILYFKNNWKNGAKLSSYTLNALTLAYESGNATFAGKVTASAFYASSDKNLKTNIEKISNSISSFNWKESGEKSYGLIALELEKTNPELVNTNDTGVKSVNYTAALCMLVAKLENRIDELERRLNEINN